MSNVDLYHDNCMHFLRSSDTVYGIVLPGIQQGPAGQCLSCLLHHHPTVKPIPLAPSTSQTLGCFCEGADGRYLQYISSDNEDMRNGCLLSVPNVYASQMTRCHLSTQLVNHAHNAFDCFLTIVSCVQFSHIFMHGCLFPNYPNTSH